jgi:hypothetical protein
VLNVLRNMSADASRQRSRPALELAKTAQPERREVIVEIQSPAVNGIRHPPDCVQNSPVSPRSVRESCHAGRGETSRAHLRVLTLDKIDSDDGRMWERMRDFRNKQA